MIVAGGFSGPHMNQSIQVVFLRWKDFLFILSTSFLLKDSIVTKLNFGLILS